MLMTWKHYAMMFNIRGILKLSSCEFVTVCYLQWIIVAVGPIVPVQAVEDGEPVDRCEDITVKKSLLGCNPDLSRISTLILQTSGSNYSHVCRAFDAYMECMQPKVIGCDSVLLLSYYINKRTYSAPPYNCSIPNSPSSLTYRNSTSRSATWNDGTMHWHIWTTILMAMLVSHLLTKMPT